MCLAHGNYSVRMFAVLTPDCVRYMRHIMVFVVISNEKRGLLQVAVYLNSAFTVRHSSLKSVQWTFWAVVQLRLI